ncbi:MAG: hypothetical protein ILP16_09535 [Spirochaetales bacterium]|nr:hypothetical protein [Spirochaetales bacterium]
MFDDFIFKKLAPPGIEKKNRRKIFNLIARLGDLMADVASQVLKNFFPLLADSDALAAHGKALSIPRYVNDTEDAYRARVASAAFFLKERGSRGFFRTSISQQFSDRDLKITEEYLKLSIELGSLSSDDKRWLYEFLDAELDPNIQIALVSKESFHDGVDPQDAGLTQAHRNDIDLYDWGLCYDGQVLAGYARIITFDGSVYADGTAQVGQVVSEDGTYSGYKEMETFYDGVLTADGNHDFSGIIRIPMPDPPEAPCFGDSSDSLEIEIIHS